jgi:D-aminopeptidase
MEAPIIVGVEFNRSEQADAASLLPGARRPEGKRIEFTAPDMAAAYKAFRAIVGLASG